MKTRELTIDQLFKISPKEFAAMVKKRDIIITSSRKPVFRAVAPIKDIQTQHIYSYKTGFVKKSKAEFIAIFEHDQDAIILLTTNAYSKPVCCLINV